MSERSDAGWLLAIDTSSDWAGIALTNGENVCELNWNAGRRQTQVILPEIDRLLGTAGIEHTAIGAITVAVGPGSFSGLRVGAGLAKGFAIATGIPVIGVSTIAATVEPWRESGRVIGVVKAGRARFVWAATDDVDQICTGRIGDLVLELESAASTIVVGELGHEDELAFAGRSHIVIPSMTSRRRRAGVLAGIGWDRWQTGEYDDLRLVGTTIYPHRTSDRVIVGRLFPCDRRGRFIQGWSDLPPEVVSDAS